MHYAPPNVKTVTDLLGFGDSYIQPGDQVFVSGESANYMYVATTPPNVVDGATVGKAHRLPGFWVRQGANSQTTTGGGILALGNFATGGSIGTAAATVDISQEITINQTTAGQALTLPNQTQAGAVHSLLIANKGTQSFTMLGATVAAAGGITAAWNGSAWFVA